MPASRISPLANNPPSSSPSFIDLFCGCGGFTLGMLRAGFVCKAAIDSNREAIQTLRSNLTERTPAELTSVEQVLERDLTAFTPAELVQITGTREVDVIVGGPPCQGFSTARQRDGSNHGTERFKDDARRHLYRYFLNYVEHFQPKVFVIENVLGLRTAAGGQYFTAVQHEARILGRQKGLPGYRVHDQVEKGEELGVPQKRRRQLIVGVRADLPGYFPSELQPSPRAVASAMLGDAIGDLPSLCAGEGANEVDYDLDRRNVQFLGGVRDSIRQRFLRDVAEVQCATRLTNHVARPHSERDLRDFERIPEGRSSAELMREGVEFEFPYDKTTFKDRYTRQHRNRPCSTIVAHLAKDGLMFIHPKQNRSLTPREAARVQTFPDWFQFPEARTHSFRMIGNAVPPLIGEAVGLTIRAFLAGRGRQSLDTGSKRSNGKVVGPQVPASSDEARQRLNGLMNATKTELRECDAVTFLKGWHALLALFPSLHPDNARDHGDCELDWPDAASVLPFLRPEQRRVHARSGWPVALVLIGEEAWRRFEAGEIAADDFYSVAAQAAGLTR